MARTQKPPNLMLATWRRRLGEWIRERRLLSGYSSQDSFGEQAGLSRETVIVVENGKRDYGIDQALLLLMYAEAKTKEDAEKLDPIRVLASALRGINNLSGQELDACRIIIEALNDPDRRTQAQAYIDLLADRSGVKGRDGTGGP